MRRIVAQLGERLNWHSIGGVESVFTSQGQAKRFFVDKIAAQAITEGTPLSDAERQMLSFSESDPEFAVDPALVEELLADHDRASAS